MACKIIFKSIADFHSFNGAILIFIENKYYLIQNYPCVKQITFIQNVSSRMFQFDVIYGNVVIYIFPETHFQWFFIIGSYANIAGLLICILFQKAICYLVKYRHIACLCFDTFQILCQRLVLVCFISSFMTRKSIFKSLQFCTTMKTSSFFQWQ